MEITEELPNLAKIADQDRHRPQPAPHAERAFRRHEPLPHRVRVESRQPGPFRVPRDRLRRRQAPRKAGQGPAAVRRQHPVLRRRPRLPRPGLRPLHARPEERHLRLREPTNTTRFRSTRQRPAGRGQRSEVGSRSSVRPSPPHPSPPHPLTLRPPATSRRQTPPPGRTAQNLRHAQPQHRRLRLDGRDGPVPPAGPADSRLPPYPRRLRHLAGNRRHPPRLRRHPLGPQPADLPAAGRGRRAVRAVPGDVPLEEGNRPHHQLGRPLRQRRHLSRPARSSPASTSRSPPSSRTCTTAASISGCCSSSPANSAAPPHRPPGQIQTPRPRPLGPAP